MARQRLFITCFFVALLGAGTGPAAAQGPAFEDGPPTTVVEVVPILGDAQARWGLVLPDWMADFAPWATNFWERTSGGRLRLRLRPGRAMYWDPCPTCMIDPFDREAMRTWLNQLETRHRRSDRPPDAYLLLAPTDRVKGAGF